MAGLVGGGTPHPGWVWAARGGALSPGGPDEETDVHRGVRAGVDGWTEGRVQLGSRHPAHRTLLPVWPLASRAPAGWRTGRPLRGGGLNEPVCTPSCPAGRRLAQNPGDGCRAALGGPGCAPPPPAPAPTRSLGAAGLQAGVAEGGSGLPLDAVGGRARGWGRAPGEAPRGGRTRDG